MKKLALLCLCLTAALSAAAVNPPVGVERVRWWDPEYLTVTWGGDITPGEIMKVILPEETEKG